MTSNTIDTLAADIREADGNHDLGAAELAEALVAKGWTRREFIKPEVNLHPALSAYRDGEKVEAMKQGAWMFGHITSRDRVSGHLHIHTDRGPVTVASTHAVRKLA